MEKRKKEDRKFRLVFSCVFGSILWIGSHSIIVEESLKID